MCVASCHCIFRRSEVSESETKTTVILLQMTAGQSDNWLVDMSLSITDVSIGAEHWSEEKEPTVTSIIQPRPKLSTASSFYLSKLTSYSTWHRWRRFVTGGFSFIPGLQEQ